VRLDVEASAAFDRRGQDLYTVLDISATQATLGGEVEVRGIDDTETIKIDPGTPSGTVLRLKGRGIPNVQRRGRGDMFVTLHVVTTRDLSREARRLYEQLAEMEGLPRKGPARGELRRPEL
jgi:molecular chaperone DnaJ